MTLASFYASPIFVFGFNTWKKKLIFAPLPLPCIKNRTTKDEGGLGTRLQEDIPGNTKQVLYVATTPSLSSCTEWQA